MTRLVPRGTHILALAAALTLAACAEPTAPTGTPGEVTVRVYVDIDGSGTFTAGDRPVEGIQVRLEPREGLVTDAPSATTDSNGLARFPNVMPGAYAALLEGDPPPGAILASGRVPTVAVPFQGGQVEAQFRFVFNPGDVEGVLFRDEDGSGDFTPGVDAPAPGVTVRLFSGTDTSGSPTASTVTDSEGRFLFEEVRSGTATLVLEHPETIEIVGGSVQQVEIQPESLTRVEIRFEGSLLVPIEDARSQGDGAAVEVEGVVLADQGTYDFQARDTYIQDGTAGIRLWQLDPELGLQVGDSVRVAGSMDTFNDERQLTVSSLTVLGAGTVPGPRPVSGAEINSFELDGRLGVTPPVTVVSVQVFGFDAHNVTVEDPEGTTFVIRMDSPNEIPSDFWQEGDVHVVTGVIARFRGTGQIKPRGFPDVGGRMDIADARAAEDGVGVFVEGVVLADQGTYDFQGRDTYIQDSTGGVRLWALDGGLGLVEGDSVRVSGTMDTFNDERQLTVSSLTVLGTGTVPDPRPVTGAEINSFELDGQLGVTPPVTVVSVQVFGFDAHNVTVEDPEGTTFVIRMDSPNEIPSDFWEEGQTHVITGVIARFRGTGQIKPRGFADVEEP